MASNYERSWDFMPRWPKPNIKRFNARTWIVVFTNPLYPHTRYTTGHHATTVAEAWEHLPVMQRWYGI